MSTLQQLLTEHAQLQALLSQAKAEAITQARKLVTHHHLQFEDVFPRRPFQVRTINRQPWAQVPPKPISAADLVDTSPNAQLRRTFAMSGLSYDGALATVNKTLARPMSYSTWRSYLAKPNGSNFRVIRPALLAQLVSALNAQKGQSSRA